MYKLNSRLSLRSVPIKRDELFTEQNKLYNRRQRTRAVHGRCHVDATLRRSVQ